MGQVDVKIKTQAKARLPKEVIIGGHDLSNACHKAEVHYQVGAAPIVVVHLYARDVDITHEPIMETGTTSDTLPSRIVKKLREVYGDDVDLTEVRAWRLNVDEQELILEFDNESELLLQLNTLKQDVHGSQPRFTAGGQRG